MKSEDIEIGGKVFLYVKKEACMGTVAGANEVNGRRTGLWDVRLAHAGGRVVSKQARYLFQSLAELVGDPRVSDDDLKGA
jgi:hypothetical protein